MAVDLELQRKALGMDIAHASRAAKCAINELRILLDRIEWDLKENRRTTTSNDHRMTELYHHLGERDALMVMMERLKDDGDG